MFKTPQIKSRDCRDGKPMFTDFYCQLLCKQQKEDKENKTTAFERDVVTKCKPWDEETQGCPYCNKKIFKPYCLSKDDKPEYLYLDCVEDIIRLPDGKLYDNLNREKSPIIFWGTFQICYYKDGDWRILFGGDDVTDIDIKYCFHCGRKLD